LNGKATLNKAREFNTGKDSVNKAMLQKALLKEGNTELLPAVDKSLKGFQDVNPTNNVSPESIIENAINAEEKLQELALIKATALVNSIDRIKSASINTLGELRVIDENASLINNRNIVALLALYNSTANSWIGLINQINEILEDYTIGTDGLFYQTLNEVLNNSTMIVKKIGEIYKKNNVQLFPSVVHAGEKIYIQTQTNDNTLCFFELSGKEIYRRKFSNNLEEIVGFSPGVYLYSVISPGFVGVSGKMIIQ
jgi:hypothetical protein